MSFHLRQGYGGQVGRAGVLAAVVTPLPSQENYNIIFWRFCQEGEALFWLVLEKNLSRKSRESKESKDVV